MSQFTKGELRGRFLPANRERAFELQDSLVWETGVPGSGKLIVTPENFITDLASIPRIAWTVVPPYGRISRPAVLHDFCYRAIILGIAHEHAPTRRIADNIFLEAMLACRCTRVQAYAAWVSVRLFGGFVIRKQRQRRAAERGNVSALCRM